MGCFSPSQPSQQSQQSSGAAKTPSQTETIDQLLAAFRPSIGAGQELPEGPLVAGPTQTQQDIFSTAGDFARSIQPVGDIPLFGETSDAVRKLLAGEGGAQPITAGQTEDFFNRAVADPARFSFQDVQRPLIREEFAGPGFSSSARAQEVARQGQDLERGLGEARAGLEFDVLKQNQAIEQQKAFNTLSALPAAMSLGTLPENVQQARLDQLTRVLQLATPEQLNQQAQIDEQIERFAADRRIVDPENLGILLSLLDLNFMTNQTTGTTRGPEQPGLGLSLLGLA